MKKILFSLVALVCSMSMNAQIMKVLKNGEVEATYKGSEYEVTFEEEIIEPFHYIGEGQWKEWFPTMFGEDEIFIDVDVYESDKNPGRYKIYGVGLALANWFYEQDMTPYEGQYWNNDGLIIDATDPDNVFMPEQMFGFYAGSSYGWPVITSFDPNKGTVLIPGTLVDGVISFPNRGMLCGMGTSYYYFGNEVLYLPTQSSAKPKFTSVKKMDKISNKELKMNSAIEFKADVR